MKRLTLKCVEAQYPYLIYFYKGATEGLSWLHAQSEPICTSVYYLLGNIDYPQADIELPFSTSVNLL